MIAQAVTAEAEVVTRARPEKP